MTNYTISGAATLPSDGSAFLGKWLVRIPSSTGTAVDGDGSWRGGIEYFDVDRTTGACTISLPETTGDETYTAQFVSKSGIKLGPYQFTLTANTTWADIMETPTTPPITPSLVQQVEDLRDETEQFRDDVLGAGNPNDVIIAAALNNPTSDTTVALTSVAVSSPIVARALGWEIATDPEWGVHNDGTETSTELQAFLDYLATNGGHGYLPPGTYNVDTALSVASSAAPFRITGAGQKVTTLVRDADIGSLLTFDTCNDFELEHMSIDGGFATYGTNANHLIIALDCSFWTMRHLTLTNWKNSAILAYAADGDPRPTDGVMDSITAIGNGATTNNGLLFANMDRSFIRNCNTQNILGSPGIGQQLKNECRHSGIYNGYALQCDDAYSFGTDNPGVYSPKYCESGNLIAQSCNVGVAIGEAVSFRITGILIDRTSAPGATVGACITLDGGALGVSIVGATIVGVPNSLPAVRFYDATSCSVEADYISSAYSVLGVFDNTDPTHCSLRVARATISGSPLTGTFTPGGAFDYGNGTTNRITYAGSPIPMRATIASDTITISDPLCRTVRLDTEAAAASDNLTTINGGVEGQQITLQTTANARDVVVTDGTINLVGSANFTLSHASDSITLVYSSALSQWCEVSRADNAA